LVAHDQRAYIRRVMWIDFEERLTQAFQDFCPTDSCAEAFGHLYLSYSAKLNPAYAKGQVLRSNSMNHAQVSTGIRPLKVAHNLGKGDSSSLFFAYESGAAIVFSQNVAGTISVILYPYKSDLAKIDEHEILIASGLEPNELTLDRITKYLEKFSRYCVATSAHTRSSFSDYAYRLWLLALDKRNRGKQNRSILIAIEKFILLALAALGVWATLFTGSKWPPWH
jgi:hypothetical protein